jgi:hypothetical protein
MNLSRRKQLTWAAGAVLRTVTVGALCSAPINLSSVDGKTCDWLFLALLAGLILTISGTCLQGAGHLGIPARFTEHPQFPTYFHGVYSIE